MKNKIIRLFAAAITVIACGTICTVASNSTLSKPNEGTWTIKRTTKCDACKGTGQKEVHKNCYCDGKGCSRCDYKGYTITSYTCSKCGGSGKITIETHH